MLLKHLHCDTQLTEIPFHVDMSELVSCCTSLTCGSLLTVMLSTVQQQFLLTRCSRCYAVGSVAYAITSVCLSVTSQSSVDAAGRIKLVSGTESTFHSSYTVL